MDVGRSNKLTHAYMQPKTTGKEDQHRRRAHAVCCCDPCSPDDPQIDRWTVVVVVQHAVRWPENDELGTPTGFGRR